MGGLDRGSEADDLGEAVGEEIADPEVAGGVDGDGVDAYKAGIGGPASSRGDGIAG